MRWIFLSLAVVSVYAATPILRSTFDDSTGAWAVMGGTGTLRLTRDAAEERESRPSLAFDYEIAAKKFGAAILRVEPASLATMDQIHFWVKSDHATTIAVVLSEKGGGNYTAMAWSPGGVWQEVKIQPRDFSLGDRVSDPPDPDGQLDVDQVQGIGIADLGQLFGAAQANARMPFVVSQSAGNHTLLVSGFEVLSGASAGASTGNDKLVIDGFDGPQLSWLSPGGATLRLDTSRDHAPGPAMEVAYNLVDEAAIYFARNLPPEIPANITHISFDIAAEKPAQLIFSLQEKGSGRGEGPRYHTTVEVRGGGKTDHRDLALSAFVLDQNGPPDTTGALNIAKGKTLGIGDISAAANGDHGPNRIWLSNMRLTSRE